MENGSGGFISDLVFEGGMYGMWVGNQQFTSRNITIRGASIAGLYLNWDWGWTFKDLLIENSPVGIDIGSEMGSMTLLDCTIRNVSIAGIRTQYDEVTATKQYNDLIIDNLVFDATVSGSSNTVVLNAFDKVSLTVTEGKQEKVISWVQGMVWDGEKGTITAVDLAKEGKAPKKSSSLLVGGRGDDAESMFSMPRPAFDSATYAKLNAVTDLGVINDGETDTTEKLQQAILAAAKQSKVLYLPYGTYLITDTLYIPTGTRVLGEAWSIIMVGGDSVFQDQTKPVPAIQVGESSGEVGLVQLVDLLITTKGPQPGAILMQWNVRAPTTDRGATGMWEVHFRIGGAIGTSIDPQHCPRGDGAAAPASACTGAWAMFHVTDKGNGILENVWLWSADHDLDYDDQINVYNYRGMLIESTGPMWLYGTAAEHSILYQYNLNKASDIFMGMIQTETPYYQPSTLTPFTAEEVARVDSDPTFCTNDLRCSMALAVNVANSNNIYLYGAGLYR